MTAMRGPRLQVGSAAWIGEERSSSLQIVEAEVEEFSYSARNELEWINEHMAGILNENEINLAEVFKSPSKFRGKTPQTTCKQNAPESRMPLSDVFAAASNGPKSQPQFQPQPQSHPHPFPQPQLHHQLQPQPQPQTLPSAGRFISPQLHALSKPSPPGVKPTSPRRVPIPSPKKAEPVAHPVQDSGFYGSQDFNTTDEFEDPAEFDKPPAKLKTFLPPSSPLRLSPLKQIAGESPEKTLNLAREGQTFNFTLGPTASSWPNREETDKEEEESAGSGEERNEAEDYIESYTPEHSPAPAVKVDEDLEDARSSSEASSPLRPLGRKSSLNFASLPAREPLAGGKSLGGNNRTSFLQRATGGKSLGNLTRQDSLHDEDNEGMDVDEAHATEDTETEKQPLNHAKSYTQRLQDQISMLGKPTGNGQAKAVPNVSTAAHAAAATAPQASTTPVSSHKDPVSTTPDAKSQDDDDDWIDPPKTVEDTQTFVPSLSKSFTADIMEGIHSKVPIGQPDFGVTKKYQDNAHASPQKLPGGGGGKGFQTLLEHGKTASITTMSTSSLFGGESLILAKSGSNSELTLSETNVSDTPSKTPSRTLRDSPLKQVKNKLSSILKSSRGLLASSAAISAEGKSLMSPSSSRLALHLAPSSESIVAKPEPPLPGPDSQAMEVIPSPTKPVARRTRASTEREKEDKRREKEAKLMADQMDKLEKAREEEREKARIFNKEQEQIAAMEKRLASQTQPLDRPMVKDTPSLVKGSPEKTKFIEETDSSKPVEAEVEMMDKEPAASTRPGRPSQLMRPKESKRPVKPTKEISAKTKQAPTVIRVNTGSQTSQFHPTGNRVSTAPHDTAGPASSQPSTKAAGKATLQTKSSSQNLKSLSTAGRPKALEMSVRKKEQEEKEAQRRRDAKADLEKKRLAAQEKQRTGDAEERRLVQRQAALEKAKQCRAPPPALRSQPFGPPDVTTLGQQKGEPSRPPSRMTSGVPVSSSMSSAVKAGAKRALITDSGDEGQSKRPPSRGGPSYQIKDAKRRRTSEVVDDADSGHPRNIKGPPVRPSAGFKKDLPTKSVFQGGYGNAPHSVTRDLFKATVTAQHNSHIKASHPLDMAQISKGPIPFAPSHHTAAGSSHSHKTPARPGTFASTKSTVKKSTRSSPRFQNGDSIELPEIETDDEDEDDDAPSGMVAAWADSPDLRKALIRQETLDPSQIFGPPAPLNMEEVFNKSKDKWHKFRQRTSSANWSGLDRLTEDDIRKDMAARDKLRRDGGWSYEMSKNL